ncbi:MAG: hypothetical protein KDD42_06775 [Bdellovibrionales bacterium]|nr:hypothetical protein [Bdellovibrionales bacterium]
MRSRLKVACLGHRIYFENHFVERSCSRYNVEWFDYDHHSPVVYEAIKLFCPDVLLIYRPELHSEMDLNALTGVKIGFSTEPFPKISLGTVNTSDETNRRISIFSNMSWSSFDAVYHYDAASSEYCKQAGFGFNGYRLLPINTDYFFPRLSTKKIWDVVFVGKATQRRIGILQRLKSINRPFLWIEHGVFGAGLARLFRQSRCVLNIHADDLPALEPRVYLAAACGVPVLSDPLSAKNFALSDWIFEEKMDELSFNRIDRIVADMPVDEVKIEKCLTQARAMSASRFIGDVIGEVT